MTPVDLQGWLQLGIGGLMLLALVLGYRRLWVFGSFYTDMIADRDRWRDIALRGITAAEKGAAVADHLAKAGNP